MWSRWFPVWLGILEATGHLDSDTSTAIERLTGPVAWSMVLDPANPNSLASSIRATRENMRLMRDFFSPETWSVISRLNEQVEDLAVLARSHPRRRRAAPDGEAQLVEKAAAAGDQTDAAGVAAQQPRSGRVDEANELEILVLRARGEQLDVAAFARIAEAGARARR